TTAAGTGNTRGRRKRPACAERASGGSRAKPSRAPRQIDRETQKKRVREHGPQTEAHERKIDSRERQPTQIAGDGDRQLRERESYPAHGNPADPRLLSRGGRLEGDDSTRDAAVVDHHPRKPHGQ